MPLERRLAIYGVLTVGITLVVWRFTHWFLWRWRPVGTDLYYGGSVPNPGGYARTPPASQDLHSGFATQLEPAAWIDPVSLVVGLAFGLLLTWVYARFFEAL